MGRKRCDTNGHWTTGQGELRATQEMNLDVFAFSLAPEFTNQRECLAADREVSAVMLDAAHLVERLFVERGLTLRPGSIDTQQAEPAIVAEHCWMHASKVGGDL